MSNSVKKVENRRIPVGNKMIKFFENDRFAASIGAKLIEVVPGYAVAEMEITEQHFNAVNTVQGGAIFTLADFAFAAASNSHGQVAVAINVNISYIHAPRGKKLTAEAREISRSDKLANYNVDIFDEGKTLIANFKGMVYRKKDKIAF